MTYWVKGIAFASVLGMAMPSWAVVLCAKTRKDGTFNSTVRIRETCRKKETQLDPAALGLQGPPGQDGAPGENGAPGKDARQDAMGLLAVIGQAGDLTTTSTTFQDIPDTAVSFTTPTAGCVIAHLTALTRGDLGNALIRILLDGQQMDPMWGSPGFRTGHAAIRCENSFCAGMSACVIF